MLETNAAKVVTRTEAAETRSDWEELLGYRFLHEAETETRSARRHRRSSATCVAPSQSQRDVSRARRDSREDARNVSAHVEGNEIILYLDDKLDISR